MIELFAEDIKTENRQSSKGNQLKFERNGIWYKADYLGYEGLSEYVISKLLSFSTMNEDEYVDYDLEQLTYNGNVYNGCKSRDFTDGWQLITLERLYQQLFGYGLHKAIYRTEDYEDRLKLLVENVERLTGIPDFGIYMSKMLTIDSIFLNEDRHTHNLAVLTDGTSYKLCPIFDNGAGLLSDTMMDYPMNRYYIDLIKEVRAATFCDSFEEQLDIAEKLYGYNLRFTFDYNNVKRIVDDAKMYDEDIRTRVIDIIMQMRRRYEYLFKK